ncbi:MAG TPA: hypothetical protein VM386_05755 [Acidimicrobiales bacterium]|nr:hypothetical protein [Acidimicrobiales bacterium]
MAAVLAIVLSFCLAGCAGPVAIDPYELTGNVLSKPQGLVQLNVGFGYQSRSGTVRISPDMIRVVVDAEQDRFLVNISIPGAALGLGPEELALGMLPGGRVEMDMLFDADALYARAPLLAESLPFLLMGVGDGDIPDGDFRGWLKLASADELDALGDMMAAMQRMGGGPNPPDLSEYQELSPAQLKQLLEDSGITLSDEGVEERNGVAAHHVSVSLDYDAFAQSELFETLFQDGAGSMPPVGSSFTTDLWFDQANQRPLEVSLTGSAGDGERFELVILFSEPDAGTTFDAPAIVYPAYRPRRAVVSACRCPA